MAYTLEANSISASSTPSQKQVGCIRLAGIFNCCVRQHDPRRCSFIYVPPLIFQKKKILVVCHHIFSGQWLGQIALRCRFVLCWFRSAQSSRSSIADEVFQRPSQEGECQRPAACSSMWANFASIVDKGQSCEYFCEWLCVAYVLFRACDHVSLLKFRPPFLLQIFTCNLCIVFNDILRSATAALLGGAARKSSMRRTATWACKMNRDFR